MNAFSFKNTSGCIPMGYIPMPLPTGFSVCISMSVCLHIEAFGLGKIRHKDKA